MMGDSVGDQNAEGGSGGSDTNASRNETIIPPSNASPLSNAAQKNGNPDHPASKFYREENRFRISTIVEIFVGIALVIVTGLQYCVYTHQANIMEVGQRPWISIDMSANTSPSFDETNNRIFTIGYTLKNVGKLPAFNVDFIAGAVQLGDIQPNPPPSWGYAYASPEKAIDTAVKSTCESTGTFSHVMFPDVPEKNSWRVHLTSAKTGFVPGFAIIGCATYTFFNETMRHQSVRIFELEMKAYGQMIDLSRTNIPFDELVFFPHPENGSRAN